MSRSEWLELTDEERKMRINCLNQKFAGYRKNVEHESFESDIRDAYDEYKNNCEI